MARLHISTNSPLLEDESLIPPDSEEAQFNLTHEKLNAEYASVFVNKGISYKALGLSFLRVETSYGESIALVSQGHIKMWVLMRTESSANFAKKVLVVQAAWQDKDSIGLVRKFYLNHLLNKYGIICSSDEHRAAGQRMWQSLVKESLGSYFVYVLTVDKVFVEIKSQAQFQSLQSKIWGTTPEYLNSRIFICTHAA